MVSPSSRGWLERGFNVLFLGSFRFWARRLFSWPSASIGWARNDIGLTLFCPSVLSVFVYSGPSFLCFPGKPQVLRRMGKDSWRSVKGNSPPLFEKQTCASTSPSFSCVSSSTPGPSVYNTLVLLEYGPSRGCKLSLYLKSVCGEEGPLLPCVSTLVCLCI